jgi:ribosome maturation factor RimP
LIGEVIREEVYLAKEISKRESYEVRTEEILVPIVQENGYELVDVEYVKEGGTWYLRAYIDKEGGIAINDCEIVSRALSEILDTLDFIDDAYILEVSSPGLGRPLKKEKDYERSMGKKIDIKTYQPIDKIKEFTGTLVAYDEETVTIEISEEDIDSKKVKGKAKKAIKAEQLEKFETAEGAEVQTVTFAKKDIALIRLAFDF